MKKKWILAGVAVGLVAVAVLLAVLLTKALYPHWINADQVERISVSGESCSREHLERFVELFNGAKYKGEDIGYGTTTEWSVGVYFTDGTYFLVHEYGNYNFMVNRYKGVERVETFFVNSRELYEFLDGWSQE